MKLPNIAVRGLAGIVFVGILLAGILINQYVFILVFSLFVVLGLYEFYNLVTTHGGVSLSKVFSTIIGLVMFLTTVLCNLQRTSIPLVVLFAPYTLLVLIYFIRELYCKRDNPIQSLAYFVLGQVYIAIPFSLAVVLVFSTYTFDPILLLAVFVLIWVNDTFAYLTGRAIGKHKMFERISPKKTWEGFAGGAIFAIIGSYVFHLYTPEVSVLYWVGFALVVVVFGTLGDLIESMMKRTLKVKDSGNIIPGHGGILDRMDSTILAVPAVIVYQWIVLLLYFLCGIIS